MSLQDQLDGLLNFLQEARLCMTTDHFQGARAHHVSKFENTLRSLSRISSTEAAGILSKLRSSDCLRPEDVQQLTQPLTIRSAALRHAQASTVQGRTQDYVEFSSFLTQHHWDEINMQGVTDTIVWDILSSFLACLGCQVPSESTILKLSQQLSCCLRSQVQWPLGLLLASTSTICSKSHPCVVVSAMNSAGILLGSSTRM